MQYLASIINDQTFAAVVNVPVFIAVLLALLVNRLIGPVIDFLNPFIMLTRAFYRMKEALAPRVSSPGAPRGPRRPGEGMTVVK